MLSRNCYIRYSYIVCNATANLILTFLLEIDHMHGFAQTFNIGFEDYKLLTLRLLYSEQVVQSFWITTCYLFQIQTRLAQFTNQLFPIVTADTIVVLKLLF